MTDASGSDGSATELGDAIRETISEVVSYFRDKEGIPHPKFQEFNLMQRLKRWPMHSDMEKAGPVLVAGVGSGKTLAFMLPPLIMVKQA